MQYEIGDKAEIISIDDIVRQMCTFTDNPYVLKNGINNMHPEGMTMFYDGLYEATKHVVTQPGARCVIAFTDGQYWYIDDLYDLNEIYETIYREQKQMYQVVYTSDESLLGQYEEREIALEVGGLGYVASEESKLVPVGEKEAQAKKEHTFRYEVYMDDISWKEANIRCNEMGGHLVTITSENEFDTVRKLAEDAGASFIWLGGYTSYNAYGDVFAHWVTGEDFVYEKWCDGEPSRVDLDGTNEWYLMMWNIESLGGWTWNDQRNDPAADLPVFQGKLAYVCEYED